MTYDQIQHRRREICTQRDAVRRRLCEVRAFRVRLGQIDSSRTERQLFSRLFRLTDELMSLDTLADACVVA